MASKLILIKDPMPLNWQSRGIYRAAY